MRQLYTLCIASTCTFGLAAQPGALDPSFGTAGIVRLAPGTLHDVAYDIVALPDTSTLICGVAQHNGKNAIFISHLLQDGTLDTAFGTSNGYTFINIGEEAYGYSMARDGEGRIVVAGLAYPTYAQSTVVVVRTDANGSPDNSFGTNGVVSTPVGTTDAEAQGMAIQADGKIVVGGSAMNADNGARDILFMRYMPNGTLDTDFGTGGITIASAYASEDLLNDIAILADGSIVGAGYVDIQFDMKTVLARVNAQGAFMPAFGGDGVLVPGFNVTQDRAFGIVADGQRFLVTGSFMDVPGNDDIYLAAFRDDGTLDPAFGTNGVVLTDLNGYEVGLDVVKDQSGKFVVCGTTGQPGFAAPRDFFVGRYTSTGLPDAAFGTNGHVVTSIGVDFDDANALAIQPDGKIVAAGFTSGFSTGGDNDVAVVRYLVSGPSGIPALARGDDQLRVLPNLVATDMVQISGPALADGSTLELLDQRGRVISRRAVERTPLEMPVDGLAPGRYLIRCQGPLGLAVAPFLVVR